MTGGTPRETSLFQQTAALLWKTLLQKWRRKGHTILEWVQHLSVVLLVFIVTLLSESPVNNAITSAEVLGRLGDFNQKGFIVGYVPTTAAIRDIMEKVNKSAIIPGMTVEEFDSEEQMLDPVKRSDLVAVTFDNEFKYSIRYHLYKIPSPNEYFAYRGSCRNGSTGCYPLYYWKIGFLSLQASIDSAIVELTTKHSIWNNMATTVSVKMKSAEYTMRMIITMGAFILAICMCYVSLSYLLSLYIAKERKETREIMRMMGLKDSAFWLSWGLLYTFYVIIIANLMTLITTSIVFVESSYGLILLLFFLYGISSICFTFMLCALFRKPRLSAIAGFFITLFLSALSLLPLIKVLPKALEVLLSIFPSYAFAVGITESVHMENDLQGVFFSDITGDSSHVLSSCISLTLDSVFYIILTLYFDKILSDKHGMRHEPLFFLRSSYWSRKKMTPLPLDNEDWGESTWGDFVEKVPTELQGRETIRINKVKKMYSGKDKKTEALRGLDLDIYEGQITALLGHSGAGKTTLLNILSGMCTSSSGSATIYNYQLSNNHHLEEIQRRIGFCPQLDVKFDLLTVKENLELFSKVKGIPRGDIKKEVEKVLSDLEMSEIQYMEANKLSGGQKRKLTLAIAILGNPEVLLLDEPTAGLDPFSRHRVWAILEERKADRVTLFSTQFMDEADILADRKAVLSNGRLKCVGSSMFLKRKWGIGYHLRMQVSPSCNPEAITSLIKQHISSAKLTTQNVEDLVFSLPFENMDAFPAVLSHLDSHVGQEILSYGVSITTLDDVFLKLEGEAEIEKGDYGIFAHEQNEEENRDHFSSEMEESVLLMSDSGNATISGMALWRQQVLTMAKIRLLKLKHDMRSFRSILLLLILFIIPMVIVTVMLSYMDTVHHWELTPDLYFRRSGDRAHKYYTNLLVNNNTGSPIEDFVGGIKAQDISVDIMDGPYDTNTMVYNGAIEVSLENKSYSFRIVGNLRALSGLPVLVNIISNAFLKTFQSTERIQVCSKPVVPEVPKYISYGLFLTSMFFMVFASGLAPHFAMSSIEDRKLKARSQLRISGLFPSAYWCGQALVDIALYCLLLFLMIAILFAFNNSITLAFWEASLMIVEVLGYSASTVLYVYAITFMFGKGKSHCDRWSFFFIVSALIPLFFGIFVADFPGFYLPFMFLLPPSNFIGFLMHMSIVHTWATDWPNSLIFLYLGLTYVNIVLSWCVLWFLEWKFGARSLTTDPIFRFSNKKHKFKQNPEELEDADEEVLAERERVKNLKTTESVEEKPIIIVDSLRKEFKVKTGNLFCKKKMKKAATRHVSFCVKKGEVLGLLGPNGAGKTTSVLMLAGEMKPTAGEVMLCGAADSHKAEDRTAFLGYCPQSSPLWPNLTVKEHLEIYAAVKGMKKEDTDSAIKRVAEALELKQHVDKPARKLSAGVSRKVCFAISMLGNPTIVLLDEPSTGLDPKGQQRLWRAIRAAFRNKERGAILTTHYMEEAEALCDRVAIMVSGKLRCIGSIQQLKSKFGKGYLLEIKVKDSHQVDMIHQEIIRLFPQAARQDRFSSLLVYKIPMDNVQSLSQAFMKLEEAKRAYNIEEYSFSQSTLEQSTDFVHFLITPFYLNYCPQEPHRSRRKSIQYSALLEMTGWIESFRSASQLRQVFLELAKEQEKEDFDQDTMFKWRPLKTENI